jgi:hypothetical protein
MRWFLIKNQYMFYCKSKTVFYLKGTGKVFNFFFFKLKLIQTSPQGIINLLGATVKDATDAPKPHTFALTSPKSISADSKWENRTYFISARNSEEHSVWIAIIKQKSSYVPSVKISSLVAAQFVSISTSNNNNNNNNVIVPPPKNGGSTEYDNFFDENDPLDRKLMTSPGSQTRVLTNSSSSGNPLTENNSNSSNNQSNNNIYNFDFYPNNLQSHAISNSQPLPQPSNPHQPTQSPNVSVISYGNQNIIGNPRPSENYQPTTNNNNTIQ